MEKYEEKIQDYLKIFFSSKKWKDLSLFLSLNDVAEVLNISYESVRLLIKKGDLIAKKTKTTKNYHYQVLKPVLETYIKRSVL